MTDPRPLSAEAHPLIPTTRAALYFLEDEVCDCVTEEAHDDMCRANNWAEAIARIEHEAAAAERARLAALVAAARLPRNVLIYDGQSSDYFKGEWVAVPRADFDVLRAALDRSEDK